jgi:hypothetical protein
MKPVMIYVCIFFTALFTSCRSIDTKNKMYLQNRTESGYNLKQKATKTTYDSKGGVTSITETTTEVQGTNKTKTVSKSKSEEVEKMSIFESPVFWIIVGAIGVVAFAITVFDESLVVRIGRWLFGGWFKR